MKTSKQISKKEFSLSLKSFVRLMVSLFVPLAVGTLAGMITATSVTSWYTTLHQPFFSLPSWIFAPVWTVLYLVMGFSFYLIWMLKPSKARSQAMVIFGIQLLLNFGWTLLFFYFKTIGGALAEMIVLWISIFTMIIAFYRIKPLAAFLNIPYILWVTFAMMLNAGYWILN